jgi:tRNA nucleotidyltransferase/poly(A) polymerase
VAPQPEVLWAAARTDNAMARDFTCNAIMFDPFSALLLDYAGGFRDCQRRVLRTVADPKTSFCEDPARMLRAVRHAARVGELRLPSPLDADSEASQMQQISAAVV